MINCYLQFCSRYNLGFINPSVSTIISYLEFLTNKLTSPKSVANYWAAVKTLHWLTNSSFQHKEAVQVQLMLRAIPLTKRHVSQQKQPLQKDQLLQMCYILDGQGSTGLVLKCALLFGYFGFFRASNLCPSQLSTFDNTRHFTRSDVSVGTHGITVKLKWAKNLQNSAQPKLVPIPHVSPSTLDPVSTFIAMCKVVPQPPNSPLFMLPNGYLLTVYKLRAAFKILCKQLSLDHTTLSVHSLRRGGASHAHVNGALPIDIQRHGSWASLSFWDYIANFKLQDSTVCTALTV